MSVVQASEVKWTPDQMVEVTLGEPDDFLKVRETLTRIGVASRKEKKIYQSCHILHKQGRYFLVHFKELFALDGKHANLTSNDVQRRNRITQLLADWGLIGVVDVTRIQDIAPLNQIKVLSYKDKGDWILETKYNIGAKKKKEEDNKIQTIAPWSVYGVTYQFPIHTINYPRPREVIREIRLPENPLPKSFIKMFKEAHQIPELKKYFQ